MIYGTTVQFDLHSLKFNMEPENGALKEEIPFRKPSFSGSMFVLRRVHVIGQPCWTKKSPKNEYSGNAPVLKGDDLLTSPFLTPKRSPATWPILVISSVTSVYCERNCFLSNTKSPSTLFQVGWVPTHFGFKLQASESNISIIDNDSIIYLYDDTVIDHYVIIFFVYRYNHDKLMFSIWWCYNNYQHIDDSTYLAASARSTRNAACRPRSVVTQWVCYPANHVNAFFWIKRNALATWRPTGHPKTEPQLRMHFFRFTNRLLQLVLLNSCLNYCCLRNCLRPERSPPASGMGSNRDFEHEVPPPCTEAPCPHARGSGEHPGRRELLKQQQIH